jgi:hypothetical protein
MILSHKHKFIFIKGEKVAGTSAEIALSRFCGPGDIITPITPIDERHRIGTAGEPRNYLAHLYPAPVRRFLERRLVDLAKSGSGGSPILNRAYRYRFFNHMPLQAVLGLVPEARDYQVVCVERSPYAKVMSLANWVKHHQSYGKTGELPEERVSFTGAVRQLIADGSIRRVLNIERYRDRDGRVAVKPWKTETLASDLAGFLQSRGLEPVEPVSAKRGANSDSIDPAEALRPDQIAAINEIFAEEFALFGWPMIGAERSE